MIVVHQEGSSTWRARNQQCACGWKAGWRNMYTTSYSAGSALECPSWGTCSRMAPRITVCCRPQALAATDVCATLKSMIRCAADGRGVVQGNVLLTHLHPRAACQSPGSATPGRSAPHQLRQTGGPHPGQQTWLHRTRPGPGPGPCCLLCHPGPQHGLHPGPQQCF